MTVNIVEGTWWERYGRTKGQDVVVRVGTRDRYVVFDFPNTRSLWLPKQPLLKILGGK